MKPFDCSISPYGNMWIAIAGRDTSWIHWGNVLGDSEIGEECCSRAACPCLFPSRSLSRSLNTWYQVVVRSTCDLLDSWNRFQLIITQDYHLWLRLSVGKFWSYCLPCLRPVDNEKSNIHNHYPRGSRCCALCLDFSLLTVSKSFLWSWKTLA